MKSESSSSSEEPKNCEFIHFRKMNKQMFLQVWGVKKSCGGCAKEMK